MFTVPTRRRNQQQHVQYNTVRQNAMKLPPLAFGTSLRGPLSALPGQKRTGWMSTSPSNTLSPTGIGSWISCKCMDAHPPQSHPPPYCTTHTVQYSLSQASGTPGLRETGSTHSRFSHVDRDTTYLPVSPRRQARRRCRDIPPRKV
jgi:hypothetical protein